VKRQGHLFEQICSFQNLLKAARKAQRGKRFKQSTSYFNLELEKELLNLQYQLIHQAYHMGSYKHFTIFDPKKRAISASPYPDRVVQHAICNIIEPLFEKFMIHDSYACRKNKGTHKAVDRFTEFSRINNYVLKCDIKSYFASIDHRVLYALLQQQIKDPKLLSLLGLIIDSTSSPGIPIGNLTSQILANLYLNGLDHHIKETLKCHYYLRYMDDLILFDNNKDHLNHWKEAIRQYLHTIKLELHPKKCQTYSTQKGVPFLGYKAYPTHRLILKENIKRFMKKLKKYKEVSGGGLTTDPKIISSVQSWMGYAIHADSYHLRRKLLLKFVRKG